MTDKRMYVERRRQLDYAVRRADSTRASAVEPTQREAIERARELNPGVAPHVERVRNTIRVGAITGGSLRHNRRPCCEGSSAVLELSAGSPARRLRKLRERDLRWLPAKQQNSRRVREHNHVE